MAIGFGFVMEKNPGTAKGGAAQSKREKEKRVWKFMCVEFVFEPFQNRFPEIVFLGWEKSFEETRGITKWWGGRESWEV